MIMLRKQRVMETGRIKPLLSKDKGLVLVISSYFSVSLLFQYKIKATLAHTHIFSMLVK